MACLTMSQPLRFTLGGLNIYRDREILPSLAFLLSYVLSRVEFHFECMCICSKHCDTVHLKL